MNWLKNSAGKGDAMLTFSAVSLGVVLLKFFLSDVTIGGVIFGNLDGAVIAAILGPTLGAYCMRRHTDANSSKTEETDESK